MSNLIKVLFVVVGYWCVCLNSTSYATCTSECYRYCGSNGSHGYCTDYIKYVLGVKKSGDAKNWIAGGGFINVSIDNIQINDIVIFDFGDYGHVAIVDSVNGNNITISECNYGNIMVDANCAVTNKYGIKTSRTITKNSVTRFLRLSVNPQTETETNTTAYANSGQLAWIPLGVDCKDAMKWIDIETGNVVADKSSQSVSGDVVCESYGIYPTCGINNSQY